MNQAEKIRDLTLEILKYKNEFLEEIKVNKKSVMGIKYSELKNKLLKNKEYKFTDGGVTGALYTLTDQVDSIFRVKIKNGVFFYYSDEKNELDNKKEVLLTESKEFNDLYSDVIKIHDDVGHILSKASNDIYEEVNDIDIKNLRNILYVSSQLKESLKDYKNEISFEKLEDIKRNMDILPF